MITKNINGKEILFVQVPIWAKYFEMGNTSFYYSDNEPNGQWGTRKLLDASSCQLIGLASNLTEDEWKGIVEAEPQSEYDFPSVLIYKTYQGRMPYSTATQSGQSLIQSLNLNLETTLIIEKK